jgi:hypothetical protein
MTFLTKIAMSDMQLNEIRASDNNLKKQNVEGCETCNLGFFDQLGGIRDLEDNSKRESEPFDGPQS